MKKLHPLIRSEMLKTFPNVQIFMLQNSPNDIIEQCHQGFLFSFDSWLGDYKIEKLEYIENAQFAVIDVLFENFVSYLENTEDFTNQEIRKFKLVDEIFHEHLRELAFFKFKDKTVTTIDDAVTALKDISDFMPSLILKDGKLIDISDRYEYFA